MFCKIGWYLCGVVGNEVKLKVFFFFFIKGVLEFVYYLMVVVIYKVEQFDFFFFIYIELMDSFGKLIFLICNGQAMSSVEFVFEIRDLFFQLGNFFCYGKFCVWVNSMFQFIFYEVEFLDQ